MNKRIKKYRVIAIGFVLLMALQVHAQNPPLATMIVQMKQAIKGQRPYPVLSQQFGDSFTVTKAYQVQQALVLGQRAVGFKGGLTTVAGQKKFALTEPIGGVLIKPLLIANDAVLSIDSSQYNRLMLELELGFVLKHDIAKPIVSIEALKQQIAFVHPVIELPDLGFEKTPRLLGVDIIATNAAAHSVLVGEGSASLMTDLNELEVALYKNDQLILTGQGSDAMGDQWQALLWLINHSLKQGYRLEAGQLLITGALGKMLAAEPGEYRATFADHGELQFIIR